MLAALDVAGTLGLEIALPWMYQFISNGLMACR